MQPINTNNITIERIDLPELIKREITMDVLRLDKIHPVISGNKWYKLRYYLNEATQQGKKTILTFGGAWSNHIVATAATSRLYGFNVIGIIRGEEPEKYSATLQEAKSLGMQLHFISRQAYKQKTIPPFVDLSTTYIIPEGGCGELGIAGASTILEHNDTNNYSHFCSAAGTGTMAAGIARAIHPHQQLIVISVLKGYSNLHSDIVRLSKTDNNNITVTDNFHCGGYAKSNEQLLKFINQFYLQTKVPTDFLYTGKLFYGLIELLQQNYFPKGSRILAIHSGGLQGNQSLPKGTLIF